MFGLALVITVKLVPKMLGIEGGEQEFFKALWQIVTELPDTSVVTLAVGLACLAGMLALQRFLPKRPAALAVLVGSLIASAALNLSDHGVAVVGPLPSGLAAPELPGAGWDAFPLLITGAFGIALLAFAEAMGPAQQLARVHGYEVDANRELVAIGAANAGAGLFQGFSIGASLSKSAANDRAGARSPRSLVVAAAATALAALFLPPLFKELPEAALGAIVIVAVFDMERIAPRKRLWRIRRADCVLALVAPVGVLVVGILPGLAIAVGLSLAVIVWRPGEGRVHMAGQHPSGTADVAAEVAATPGLLVVRPLQMLFFVNAAEIREAVAAAVKSADPRPDVVLLDLGLTPDLDVPALDALSDLSERLESSGSRLWPVTKDDLVLDRLTIAGVSPAHRVRVFPYAAGAALTDLSRHSSDGDAARHTVLNDLLAFLEVRRQDPGLDERGRLVLEELDSRIRQELRTG
ncbi:MAG TPA: SulP family inorganic anion transporter [Actinomycetes bacterium]